MTRFQIVIQANSRARDPEIPECFTEPLRIDRTEMAANDWKWNNDNVALINTMHMKTIEDQIEMFKLYQKAKVLRPLQAGELGQMERHIDLWPPHWQECGSQGRILFVGTVYTLVFEEVSYDTVWYCWYDTETKEWVFDCVLTSALLRPLDVFACIALGSSKKFPISEPKPPLPLQRPSHLTVRDRSPFVR